MSVSFDFLEQTFFWESCYSSGICCQKTRGKVRKVHISAFDCCQKGLPATWGWRISREIALQQIMYFLLYFICNNHPQVKREGRSSSMKIERCHIVAVYSGTNRQVGDTWHKLAHLTIEEVHLAQLRCNPSVNPAGRSVALHRDLTHTQRGPLRGTLALCASLFVVYVSPCFASIRWGLRTETRISPKWRFKGKRDF